MKNQLSKREYKYRCKIIAENHLKKECQIFLDEYVTTGDFTYKTLYVDEDLLHRMFIIYNFVGANKVVYKLGISAKQATNAFNELAYVVSSIKEDV